MVANLMLRLVLQAMKITLGTTSRQIERLDAPNQIQQQHSIGLEEKHKLARADEGSINFQNTELDRKEFFLSCVDFLIF